MIKWMLCSQRRHGRTTDNSPLLPYPILSSVAVIPYSPGKMGESRHSLETVASSCLGSTWRPPDGEHAALLVVLLSICRSSRALRCACVVPIKECEALGCPPGAVKDGAVHNAKTLFILCCHHLPLWLLCNDQTLQIWPCVSKWRDK